NSYGLNGMGDEAVKLFYQMPKESIDHLTYICVLNACSHSGLVDVARSIFNNIQTKTEIIYTTMIDCLSRRAAFEEAQQLIEQFERDHAPAITIYRIMQSESEPFIIFLPLEYPIKAIDFEDKWVLLYVKEY
ncbi:unnamed protein product, partial [Rotaria magnacalcarata]